jgi:hypothetical protein
MNSDPLSESIPRIGNGNLPSAYCRAANTHFLGLVRDRPVHRPSGRDIRHGQGKAELSGRHAALMPDQINLNEPGHRVVPVRPGPHRDLRLQQRAGLGMGPAPQHQFRPLRCKLPIDRRRAHPHQQYRIRVRQVQFPVTAQQGHEHRQHRRQPLAGRAPQHRPADHQRLDHPWTIDPVADADGHVPAAAPKPDAKPAVRSPGSSPSAPPVHQGSAPSPAGSRGHTPGPSGTCV